MTFSGSIKIVIFVIVTLVLFKCSGPDNVGAGSSSSGNARVAGILFDSLGNPAINAQVYIIPIDYNPRRDNALPPSNLVTTDLHGAYSFTVADSGIYNIMAIGSGKKNTLIKNIYFTGKPIDLPADTLHTPGAIKIMLPDNVDPTTGYVYIPGTTFAADAYSAHNKFVLLGGIPADSIKNVSIAINKTSACQIIKQDVIVTPDDTTVIINPMLPHKKRLFLNTTIDGAEIHSNVIDFPVVIRLGMWNFNFTEAMVNGEDIRFNKSDGTPLPYEIEKWDSLNGYADIWVKVDTIFGNSRSQYILMYWGNSGIVGSSNGEQVFDTANGFQGVWHMSEKEYDTAYDATANRFHGIPYFLQPVPGNWGNVGVGRFFNGSGCILIPNTAESKLTISPNNFYTISAWVQINPVTMYQVIVGKGSDYSLNMRSIGLDYRWEIFSYIPDTTAPAWKSVTDNSPVHFGDWNYIVDVCRGSDHFLYVNGKLVAQSTPNIPGPMPIPPGNIGKDFTIGGFVSANLDPSQGGGYFNGTIDEVCFSNVARSDDWIKLCYVNQQVMKTFVVFDDVP